MYLPRHYAETDVAVLHALIDAHPLGAWVTPGDSDLDINHIPFLVERTGGEFGTLVGHVAKANAVWRTLTDARESVVIFRGPDAYVSPSWYPSKREHGRVVPTWNYAVVHAFGTARAIHDHGWLRAFLDRLTARHESRLAEPWQIGDAPADYIARRLDAIVGIEVPIRRIEGKWKVSQNQPQADARGIVAGLRGDTQGAAMAGLVELRSGDGGRREP